MATGPFASGGGSTITQPVGAQTKPTISQRPLTSVRRQRFTSADLQDPERLYQVIADMSNALANAQHQLAQLPIGAGNLLTGWTFTPGQTQYLGHGLGRAWRGWIVTRAQTNAASIKEAPYPSAVTSALVLPLVSANAGVYDFYIF